LQLENQQLPIVNDLASAIILMLGRRTSSMENMDILLVASDSRIQESLYQESTLVQGYEEARFSRYASHQPSHPPRQTVLAHTRRCKMEY
jgi:hypothetical protein